MEFLEPFSSEKGSKPRGSDWSAERADLFGSNGFCEISGLIGVDTSENACIISYKLKRADGSERVEQIGEGIVGVEAQIDGIFGEFGIFARNGDNASPARLDLSHIADGFGENVFLRQKCDNGNAVLDKRDCAVFEFAGSVSLAVDIGYFLEFKRSFKGKRVVKPSADEKQLFDAYEP